VIVEKPHISKAVEQVPEAAKVTFPHIKSIAAPGCETVANLPAFENQSVFPIVQSLQYFHQTSSPDARTIYKWESAHQHKAADPPAPQLPTNNYIIKFEPDDGKFAEKLNLLGSNVEVVKAKELWPVNSKSSIKEVNSSTIIVVNNALIDFGKIIIDLVALGGIINPTQVVGPLVEVINNLASANSGAVHSKTSGYYLIGVPSLPLAPIGEQQTFSYIGVLAYSASLEIQDIKNKKTVSHSFRSELKTDLIFFSTPDALNDVYEKTKKAVELNDELRALVKTTRDFPPPVGQWKVRKLYNPRYTTVLSQVTTSSQRTFTNARNLSAPGCEYFTSESAFANGIIHPAFVKLQNTALTGEPNGIKWKSYVHAATQQDNDYVLEILPELGQYGDYLPAIINRIDYIRNQGIYPVSSNAKSESGQFTDVTILTDSLVGLARLACNFTGLTVDPSQVIDVLQKALNEIGDSASENVNETSSGPFYVGTPSKTNPPNYDALGAVWYSWSTEVSHIKTKKVQSSSYKNEISTHLIVFYTLTEMQRVYNAVV